MRLSIGALAAVALLAGCGESARMKQVEARAVDAETAAAEAREKGAETRETVDDLQNRVDDLESRVEDLEGDDSDGPAQTADHGGARHSHPRLARSIGPSVTASRHRS